MMIFAGVDWTSITVAIIALIGAPGTLISLFIFYRQWRNGKQKQREDEILRSKEREDALKKAGREELLAEQAEEQEEKDQKQMQIDLIKIKKVFEEAQVAQTTAFVEAQKKELGSLKTEVLKVQASQKNIETGSVGLRKLWERVDSLATEVKDDRHATENNFAVFQRWAEAHTLDNKMCLDAIMEKLDIDISKRPKLITPVLPNPLLRSPEEAQNLNEALAELTKEEPPNILDEDSHGKDHS